MKLPEGPGLVDNRYQEGDPATALAATTLRAVDMNALTYEIINVIEGAGLALDPGREDQMLEAITKMIEENLAPDASETTKGIVELATAQETETGTDNTRAVTPAAAQATYLKRSQNLAGLADVAAARANIEAMHTGANLSDVADPAAARNNIGAAGKDVAQTFTALQTFEAGIRLGHLDDIVWSSGGDSDTTGRIEFPGLATRNALIQIFRATSTTGSRRVVVYKGDGTATEVFAVDAAGNAVTVAGSLSVGGGAAIARVLSAAATLNFGTLNPGDSATRTMTVSGAATGDPVFLGWIVGPDLRTSYRVSNTNQVSIYVENTSTSTTYDMSAVPVRAVVFKF